MRTKNHLDTQRLPAQFEQLVQMMPPQAVQDEVQYANTLEVIDRLMAVAKLTKGQALYLETLVQEQPITFIPTRSWPAVWS